MIAAPRKAVYIWCNARLDYPRDLARKLDRRDLIISAPTDLVGPRLKGLLGPFIIDHACELTEEQDHNLRLLRR